MVEKDLKILTNQKQNCELYYPQTFLTFQQGIQTELLLIKVIVACMTHLVYNAVCLICN